MIAPPPRVLVLWCPDWPVVAATREAGIPADAATALIAGGIVFASSPAARQEGVRRGLRLREAQARHPALHVLDYDPALDSRAFEPLVAGIEQFTPGVHVLRPGMLAVRVRGTARYYGGERAAAIALAARAQELGALGASAGVADGIFTADRAARMTGADRVRIVPAGESAAFLNPLPIGLLDEAGGPAPRGGQAGIVTLLRRLGIQHLGGFAALAAEDVRTRFGEHGARLHALAAGGDSLPVAARTPPPELDAVIDFEPALDRVDQVAFAVRAPVEEFVERLMSVRLVATAIRVRLHSEAGDRSERVWLHPRSFAPADIVDRVRWQLHGSGQEVGLRAGIVRVGVSPEAVDAVAHHETGLWGTGPDERIHHGLSRVQSMLGHGAVLMPGIGGGRTLAERQQLVAWGDRPVAGRPADRPWPGRLPAPLPGTVFTPRRAVHVLGAAGESVGVSERGVVTSAPATFSADGRDIRRITAWAGPWPLDERWWSPEGRSSWRFQAVEDSGCAWLLALDAAGWWAEARYD
jgi:protein ImuB